MIRLWFRERFFFLNWQKTLQKWSKEPLSDCQLIVYNVPDTIRPHYLPRKSKNQTLPHGSRESFTWIILKTILCLVLDFQGLTCPIFFYFFLGKVSFLESSFIWCRTAPTFKAVESFNISFLCELFLEQLIHWNRWYGNLFLGVRVDIWE